MSSVIAKFLVTSVEQQGHSHHETGEPQLTGVKVNLSPVYRPKDSTHENQRFWEASPSGQLWLQIQNPQAFGFFQAGHEEYVIFVDAAQGKDGLIASLERMLAALKAD